MQCALNYVTKKLIINVSLVRVITKMSTFTLDFLSRRISNVVLHDRGMFFKYSPQGNVMIYNLTV